LELFWDIFEVQTRNQIKYKKKTGSILYSQIDEKVSLKWPWKSLKKTLLKSMKNVKSSGFYSDLRGLNYQSYQLFEATFQ
jgi:hypothetical protein